MKVKLTLSIEKELIPVSKAYAKVKGLSLSQLIEKMLNEKMRMENPRFSEKWRGKFEPIEKDDLRFKKLSDRFSL